MSKVRNPDGTLDFASFKKRREEAAISPWRESERARVRLVLDALLVLIKNNRNNEINNDRLLEWKNSLRIEAFGAILARAQKASIAEVEKNAEYYMALYDELSRHYKENFGE